LGNKLCLYLELLEKWCLKNNVQFTGLIIPNVFGPFGNPYYNSFIATFCHQLTHNETPNIDVDGIIKLIYIGELVKQIVGHIVQVKNEYPDEVNIEKIFIQYTSETKHNKKV